MMSLLSSSEDVLKGVGAVADAVGTTLGPKGREVTTDPNVTKKGVEIAYSIILDEKFEDIGANVTRMVVKRTNEIAGDGTKTAAVLARVIHSESIKNVAAGSNLVDLRQGLQAAADRVVEFLSANAKKVTTTKEIAQVAAISANGDTHAGNLIAQAMEKVGKEDVIIVNGSTDEDELEVAGGVRSIYGFLSPYFVTDQTTQKVEFKNPLVLLTEKKLSDVKPILPVMEAAAKSYRPLLIMAEDVVEEALATCVDNMVRGTIKVAAVKAPGFGAVRKSVLGDLAVFTGGTVFTDELETATADLLGSAGYVIISKDDTLIFNGRGSKDAIEARRKQIRDIIDGPSMREDAKFMLQKRLEKLSNEVAAVKVGGSSEVEKNEKRNRYELALNATRAFVEEGILPGGGVALLKASELAFGTNAEPVPTSNSDQDLGVNIIRQALTEPIRTILTNAGKEASEIVEKLLGEYGSADAFAMGYDVNEGKYVDMFEAGIVDSLKVVRTTFMEALGVASRAVAEK